MTAGETGTDVRAVKDALRALVEGRDGRTGGDAAAAVADAEEALSDVERAAAVADAGGFERVRAAERTAGRREDAALARRCRGVLDALDAYRRAANGDGSIDGDTGDAGLMSGDAVSTRHE